MATNTITRGINDGANPYNFPETVTNGVGQVLDQSIAGTTTDEQLTFSFTKSKLKSIVMWADVAMKVCTNDTHSGSPAETILLAVGRPLEWSSTDPLIANPFSTNVTSLYVSVAGSTAGSLHIRTIEDPVT